MSNLVKVNFHGGIWTIPTEWDLAVNSVSEAIHAIQTRTKKLYQHLIQKDKENIKYQIIINGENYYTDNPPDINDLNSIENCELRLCRDDLKTIDIVPVLEGADSGTLGIFTAILGVLLIIIGIAAIVLTGGIGTAGGVVIIGIGITLLAAGVFTMLSRPPKFEDFREIEQGGKTSYLFSGPQNVIGEGGPVPVGYGRLLVGSQVISAAYVIRDYNTEDTSVYLRDEYGNLTFTPSAKPVNPTQPPCCFIFIQGEGLLTQYARNYRDTYYGNLGTVAEGYRWMAKWLVPLMKKYTLIQNSVKYLMTTPLSRFFEWHYKVNKYGFIFWPFKLWIMIWRMIGVILKTKNIKIKE